MIDQITGPAAPRPQMPPKKDTTPLTKDQVERLLSLSERAPGLASALDEIARANIEPFRGRHHPDEMVSVYEALREDLEEMKNLVLQHWAHLYD